MGDSLKMLLVQPSGPALLALRATCLAAGTLAPAWLAYKAAQPSSDPKAKDRALRLLVANGLFQVAERTVAAPCGLARWRHWPSIKLAVVLWFLLEGGKGSDTIYAQVARLLAPYESDLDAGAEALGPLLHHMGMGYLIPLRGAAVTCATVCMAGYRLARARLARCDRQPWGRRPALCAHAQQHKPGGGFGDLHMRPLQLQAAAHRPHGPQQHSTAPWERREATSDCWDSGEWGEAAGAGGQCGPWAGWKPQPSPPLLACTSPCCCAERAVRRQDDGGACRRGREGA